MICALLQENLIERNKAYTHIKDSFLNVVCTSNSDLTSKFADYISRYHHPEVSPANTPPSPAKESRGAK